MLPVLEMAQVASFYTRGLTMVGFVTTGGQSYAGKHLLIDLYDCANHGSQQEIQEVMIKSCQAAGATVLFSYLHPFTGGGVSGAVILAESHERIHTWPEMNFVSLDIFVCGDCDPWQAVPILTDYFQPTTKTISEQKRGVLPAAILV